MSSLPKHELMLWVGVFVCLVHLPNRLFAARINEDNKPRLAVINSSSAGRFLPGFVSSLSLTLVSELGDKTFFIAAILAMKNSRVTVFFGCMSALISMTVLSVGLGFAANAVPTVYTHYISIGLFVVFGLKMLYDGYYMNPNEGVDEYREIEKTLLNKDEQRKQNCCEDALFSGVFWQALVMTFLAEWGDRSQISTIILAARENAYMVIAGTILAHSSCSILAVIAGKFVARKISIKTVTYIGGAIFLVFAFVATSVGYEDKPNR